MTSLVHAFHGFVRAPSRVTPRALTQADESRIVFAIMLAFLVGGAAITLYSLRGAAIWM